MKRLVRLLKLDAQRSKQWRIGDSQERYDYFTNVSRLLNVIHTLKFAIPISPYNGNKFKSLGFLYFHSDI